MTEIQSKSQKWDCVIIGGGHNGLTAAAYLAKAGKSVLVVESRGTIGGAAVTETFHPGFRNSLASYTVSLLNPQIIQDLDLYAHGLRIVQRPFSNFMPLPDDRYLSTGSDLAATQAAFRRFSEKDAARLPDYYNWLASAADVLKQQLLRTPPNMGGGLRDWWRSGALIHSLRGVPQAAQHAIFDMFTRSARDILDGWFENEHIKALFGFDAVVGNYAAPDEAGSGYVLLHHVFGEVDGVQGAWGHAIGGMGAISNAIASCAAQHGAHIRCDTRVTRVMTRDNVAYGIETADGEHIHARCVASNTTPKHLLLDLVAENDLPAETRERVAQTRYGSGTFRMNVALDCLPRFTALPEAGPHLSSGIIIAPTLDYMSQAYFDARREGVSREPIVEMLIPSTLDDSLAPPGKHVASLFCQHVSPDTDPAQRDDIARRMIATVDRYAPGFEESVLGYVALTPADLESKLGLTGGDIFHGALSLNQLFSARPMLGMADYRTPIKGLYLCGSGAHPGGGVSGIPGHNAAREMLRDL
ncbi:MAG: NAD(P)/FAD-dependent oxidoreductase [Pseudomonadota bacterium]